MDDLDKLYQLIETWEATNIELALALARPQPRYWQALQRRYLPLLALVQRKTLRCLPQLPRLLLQNKHYHQAAPDLGTDARAALGSIPVDQLYWVQPTREPIGEWVTGLTQARRLQVAKTRLRALPQSLGQLVQLEQLSLSGNRLRALPDSLGELSQLKLLRIVQQRLPALPDSIGQLAALEVLQLVQHGPYPLVLPASLAGCTQLKKITVIQAANPTLPCWLYSLPQLEELTWHAAQLRVVDGRLAHCTQLRRLDLSRNPLEGLPAALATLPHLERLNLIGTPYFIGQSSGLLEGRREIQDFFKKNNGTAS